jgi:hypothetical protein
MNMKRTIGGAVVCLALIAGAPAAIAQQNGTTQGLKLNQTQGYGDGKVLTFTYTQAFDCVDQPADDLDFNGVKARNDPGEFQTPICQGGINPTINPPGKRGAATKTTDPIYVLVPLFSVNNDQNPNDAIVCRTGLVQGTLCGADLGSALIKFFGALPEGFKQTPLVFTQCPNPGRFAGTCTMHASRIDLAPVLATLGYINNPPTANVFVPEPNHSHVIPNNTINIAAEWWQVLPVLVLNANDWPTQDGSSGITSVAALKAAEKAGDAIEAPSNFFLYFASQTGTPDMKAMNMSH